MGDVLTFLAEEDLLAIIVNKSVEFWPVLKDLVMKFYWNVIDNLGWIQFSILFVSGVLLVAIVVLVKRGKREFELFRNLGIKDLLGLGAKRPIRHLKQWKRVKSNLESRDKERIAMAVIEARHLFHRLLEEAGYKGESFEMRLNKFLRSSGFEDENNLLEAEDFVGNLEGDSRQGIDYDVAKGVLQVYEKAISEELEVNI